MANIINLKFGETIYPAKLSASLIGEFLKDETSLNLETMFPEIVRNTSYYMPKFMLLAIKKANRDLEITLDDIEDLIDEDGGLTSPNLILFSEEIIKTWITNIPNEGKGKPQKKVAKK